MILKLFPWAMFMILSHQIESYHFIKTFQSFPHGGRFILVNFLDLRNKNCLEKFFFWTHAWIKIGRKQTEFNE